MKIFPLLGAVWICVSPYAFAQSAPEKDWIIVRTVTLPDGTLIHRGTEVTFRGYEYRESVSGVLIRLPWTVFSTWVPRWAAQPLHSPAGRNSVGGGAPTPAPFSFD